MTPVQAAMTKRELVSKSGQSPLISVVILNYNGAVWLQRCLDSLFQQTIFSQVQVIIADNASTDGSDQMAEALLNSRPNGLFIQNGANLGYCEGNNCGAKAAGGRYLLFLNNDTWLEDDCLEKLVSTVEALDADAASPLVCNYEDNSYQTMGATGFDLFGYLSTNPQPDYPRRLFIPPGCAFLVKTEAFWKVGAFDAEFFMYSDESDLGWRLTLAGFKSVTVPTARLHHRSAVAANPVGGGKIVEFRTNEMVRFFATRNSLLVLLKNAQCLLLLLAFFQIGCVFLEAFAVLITVRRWGIVRRSYFKAMADCWRLRHHVFHERRRIKALRQHGDFWMLRFIQVRFGRWNDLARLLRHGAPKVDARGVSV